MERRLVLSDVHGNLAALQAVIRDAQRSGGFDVVWCLGDLVGYGPHPDECVECLRQYPLVGVVGNHDLGAVGEVALDRFNPDAAMACLWTQRMISTSTTMFLRGLPRLVRLPPFILAHGSPRDPVWEYVYSSAQTLDLATWCAQPHCIVGHTHRPAVFSLTAASSRDVVELEDDGGVQLRGRLLLNPGSVGQPRDGDPRASYAVLDESCQAIRFKRVEYDVEATVTEMLRRKLPQQLALRLRAGY